LNDGFLQTSQFAAGFFISRTAAFGCNEQADKDLQRGFGFITNRWVGHDAPPKKSTMKQYIKLTAQSIVFPFFIVT